MTRPLAELISLRLSMPASDADRQSAAKALIREVVELYPADLQGAVSAALAVVEA
jgi:hypothetical protein